MVEHNLPNSLVARLTTYVTRQAGQPRPMVQCVADDRPTASVCYALTGPRTQQHTHPNIIEKAKLLLLSTSPYINEAAFRLGFEHPQYFSQLLKRKTGLMLAVFRLLG
jgi:AraC family transcriptional activator of pobA